MPAGTENCHDPYTRYRRELLSSDQVRDLSRLNPLRPVRDVVLLWLQILAAWWAVASWTHWWVVVLAIPFIGTRQYALHIIGHDGIHRRLFSSAAANDLFNDLFIFGPEAAITRINGRNHLNHHRFLSTPEDPDRHKYSSAGKATRLELLLYVCGLSGLGPLWRNVFRREDLKRRATAAQTEGYTPRDIAILLLCQGLLVGVLSWELVGGLTRCSGWCPSTPTPIAVT